MSKKPDKSAWTWFLGRLRTRFLSGLLVVVPVATTILILAWVFTTVDDIFQPVITEVIRWITKDPGYNGHIVGLGFAITIIIVLISGITAGNYVGKKLINFGDSILKRIPLFRQVYGGAKQVVESFSGTGAINKAAFREVVLVEFPARGMTTIAFITNEFSSQTGEKLYSVYIPTTPVPWSGFSAIVNEENLTRTSISIDEALKMCISGMMISPSSLKIRSGGRMITLRLGKQPKTETEEPPQG
jgi:uncharacterized membrane protein